MKHTSILFFFLFGHSLLAGQNFENSSLEGIPVSPYILDGWETVPITDPFCLATSIGHATPIITTHFDPQINTSIFGTPHSGETFLSGLYAELSGTGTIYHKGMHQVVDGFTIGENYTLQFFQSVVKQFSAQDSSGAWDVYMNDAFLATSEVSVSHLDYDDPNLQWEERKIQFIAPSESISFKFLVKDDDDEHTISSAAINGAVRMGIDDITLFSCANSPLSTINPQSLSFSEDSICVGEEVHISNWPQSFSASCQWEFSDGQSFSTCDLAALSFDAPGSISATLEMTDLQGCFFEFSSDELVVMPSPHAEFERSPESVNTTSPLVSFENLSENATEFNWNFGDGESSHLIHPIHSFHTTNDNSVEICLEALSDFGCSAEYCEILELEESLLLYIPNTVTFDQDGLNDRWRVHGNSEEWEEFDVSIFNRFGEEIFASQDPQFSWIGNANMSDYFVPSEVYVYAVKIRLSGSPEAQQFYGHISVIR